MRLRDIMTTRPLTVGTDDPPAEVERLMRAAQVHHLPLMDGDRLVGMWLATEDGPVVLLGPEAVHQAAPDEEAVRAIASLLGGAQAALAVEGGAPVGILTRADVLELLRAELRGGSGVLPPPPVVVRLVGPAGSGKSTLILRTIPMLRRCEVGVIQANPAEGQPEITGTPVIREPHAHWRKGLRSAVEQLGGMHVILVEDRDSPPDLSSGLGEDAQVVVVPLAALDVVSDESLRQAQALVVTKVDGVDAADVERRLGEVSARHPGLEVMAIGSAADDPGLAAWRDWIEGIVLRRHG
jgi:CBS domain-containing protein